MRRKFPPALLLGAVLALASPVASLAAGQRAQPRVVGGSDATIAQYPWQAAVAISPAKAPGEDAHQRQFCGGSLITSRIVITAAHCVYHRDPDCNSDASCETGDPNGDGTRKADPDDIDVVLSRTTLSNPEEGEEVPVESVTYQDHYDPTFGSSGIPSVDVAYLVLAAPASEPTIQIAGTDEAGLWAPGSNVEISGWGSTSETGDTVDTLQAATVPMTSDATCAEEYGSNFDPDTMVCAGYQDGGVDTCYGDSGGPLEAPLGDGAVSAGGNHQLGARLRRAWLRGRLYPCGGGAYGEPDPGGRRRARRDLQPRPERADLRLRRCAARDTAAARRFDPHAARCTCDSNSRCSAAQSVREVQSRQDQEEATPLHEARPRDD